MKRITEKEDPTQTYFKRIFKQRNNIDTKYMHAREKLKKAKLAMRQAEAEFTNVTNAMLEGVFDVNSDLDMSVQDESESAL